MSELRALRTPVVLLIFNRPDTTAQVFERIAEARPQRLHIVADGPRAGWAGDDEACAAARAVTERVDWPCEVSRDYADANLGCARRVSSGLDRTFERFETAIVLEDDCVPHPTFFRFCEELLERYRDDERVMAISGDNFQQGRRRGAASYYLSIYPHCWGWATWRRAWRRFDLAMSAWPALRDDGRVAAHLGDPDAVRYWTGIFDRTRAGEFDSWAYPWTFSCWACGGYAILPNVNLVANVGVGERATHTRTVIPGAARPGEAIEFPLCHPTALVRDGRADRYTLVHVFGAPPRRPLVRRVLSRLRRTLRPRGRP